MSGRQASIYYEIQQEAMPPILIGSGNALDQIRTSYTNAKIAMIFEHLPVTDQTPSVEFWQYVEALESKYKRSQPIPSDAV